LFRFNAFMTPMRASIVGPPRSANQELRFGSRQPFRRFVLRLRKLRDVGQPFGFFSPRASASSPRSTGVLIASDRVGRFG
jgi:hypothetical protein